MHFKNESRVCFATIHMYVHVMVHIITKYLAGSFFRYFEKHTICFLVIFMYIHKYTYGTEFKKTVPSSTRIEIQFNAEY